MDKPIFSIIVPVFKVREDYLRQCICSILEQTFSKFELILVDDGSPDNCGAICDEYAKKDPRVHVIHKDNEGVSIARNVGIQAAKAEWIWFIDSDDWVENYSLSILYNYVMETPDVDVFHFRCYREHGNAKQEIWGKQVDQTYDLNNPQEMLQAYRLAIGDSNESSHNSTYSWDKLFKRETIISNGLAYPVGIIKSEDKIFCCMCYEKIKKLRRLPDCLYHYRANGESVCLSFRPNLDQARLEIAKLLLPIAQRMDETLSVLFNQPGFHQIRDGYYMFMFKIITDVLCLYFYHPDYPDHKNRRRNAVRFLKTEPFKTAIESVPYRKLSKIKKVKKLLLQCRCVSSFCRLHVLLCKLRG